MTILLLGAAGQVGSEVNALAQEKGISIVGLSRGELDITDSSAVKQAFADHSPSIVINASAYTAVDKAESEPALAFAVNRDGPAAIAQTCSDLAIPLLHISTDYIFDGSKQGAYREDDTANPLGVYGQSKWEGEEAIRRSLANHIILRVSWVFGANGNNFVKTIIRLARERDELRIVADQHGCPTAAMDIAAVLLTLSEQYRQTGHLTWGTYHYTGTPETTWHGFAEQIVAIASEHTPLQVERIIPITTQEYPTPAPRPQNSVLDCSKIKAEFGLEPVPWQGNVEAIVPGIVSGYVR